MHLRRWLPLVVIALMMAVLGMTGTCWALAYVTRLGTARFASQLDSGATAPQTAS